MWGACIACGGGKVDIEYGVYPDRFYLLIILHHSYDLEASNRTHRAYVNDSHRKLDASDLIQWRPSKRTSVDLSSFEVA